jgi:hypothetical protein
MGVAQGYCDREGIREGRAWGGWASTLAHHGPSFYNIQKKKKYSEEGSSSGGGTSWGQGTSSGGRASKAVPPCGMGLAHGISDARWQGYKRCHWAGLRPTFSKVA